MRESLHRMLVQYNPLYFMSAASILGGVFLVSHGLSDEDLLSHVAIAGVAQVYEFLLIAAAWLLLRRPSLRRPAVILGLLEMVFLCDAALCAERLSYAGSAGIAIGAVLGLLGVLKLWMLARIFRLRGAGPDLLAASAVILLAPVAPYLIESRGPVTAARQATHLSLFWMGALLVAWAAFRRKDAWSSDLAVTSWARTVVSRLSRYLPFAIAGAFALHGAAWSIFLSVPLSPAHLAPYLLVAGAASSLRALDRGHVSKAHMTAGLSVTVGMLFSLAAPAPLASWPLAGSALLSAILLLTLSFRRKMRLELPGILCAFGAIYVTACGATAPLPAPSAEWTLPFAAVLAVAAGTRRSLPCLAASVVSAGWTLPPSKWLPQSAGAWGVLLLIAGFLFLGGGVGFHLLRTREESPGAQPDRLR